MSGRKREHLNEEIRFKLGALLIKEAHDPRFRTVTVVRVETAKDLSVAKVYVSSYTPTQDAKALVDSLNKAAGFFSHALARTLTARRTPRLFFYYDKGFDYAQQFDQALNQVKSKDE